MAKKRENGTDPRQPQDWQETGYRMEENPCEWAPAVDDRNDQGFRQATVDGNWQEDPFEDGAAESARPERSGDVNRRENTFWQGGVDWVPPEEIISREEKKTSDKKQKRWAKREEWSLSRRILTSLVLVLILAAIGGSLYVHFNYQIREFRVIGNERFSDQEIIQAAHLSLGMNLLFLNEDSIRQGVSEQGFMRVTGIRKLMPGTLELHVRERKESAFFTYNGIICTLDDRGVVMRKNVKMRDKEENETGREGAEGEGNAKETEPGTEGLMHVEGFSVRYCREGKLLELHSTGQLEAYMDISLELRALGLIDMVEVLYVTDTDNLYLATRDGFSVRLGNSGNIHAKIRAMQLTLGKLHEMGKSGGTVDVSTPAEPTWIPEAGS